MYSGILKSAAEGYLVSIFEGLDILREADSLEILVNAAMHISCDTPWGDNALSRTAVVKPDGEDNNDGTTDSGSEP
jgi:hypothetical protein